MSTLDHRDHDRNVGGPAHSSRVVDRRRWPDGAAAALLALADLAAMTLMLLHLVERFQHAHDDVGTNVSFRLGSDLAAPLIAWTWLLILLNACVLCATRRTRAAGVGLPLVAATIAVPVVAGAPGYRPPSRPAEGRRLHRGARTSSYSSPPPD